MKLEYFKLIVKNKIEIKNADKCSLYILGSFNLDVVTEVERFPFIGETIKAISTNFYPGGKGANQAVAAAELNDHVHFFAKVGDDSFGTTAEKYFSTTKISSYTLIKDTNSKTGNALVMVENATGNNSIVIDLGANATISKAEILSDINNLQSAKIFLTQLENNIEATKFAIEIAKNRDVMSFSILRLIQIKLSHICLQLIY